MKKKVLALILGISVVTSSFTYADYTTIYEWRSESEEIAKGVTHQNIQKFTDGGWINLNVVTATLNDQIDIGVLTDDYLSERDTLSKLVGQDDNVSQIVTAINSDFFDTSNNTTIGTLIEDGKVLTTSIGSDEFASFNITNTGLPFVGYINQPTNVFTNGVVELPITYINKPYLSYDRSIYFDQNWSKQSYGNTLGKDIAEMLVVDDVITEMRYNGLPFSIPANGYVIASVGANISKMMNYFHVGDQVTFDYDFNFDALDLAIGGGAQILINGKVPETFSQNIAGSHPRTALGISKDRKTLYFVTVDGRNSSFRGVSQKELANIMLSLGSYEAINFDGGGSTEMITKSGWDESYSIANYPSDGSERKMYTGLAIYKVLSASPVLEDLQIEVEDSDLLLGAGTPLTLKAMDSNYQSLRVPNDQIQWLLTGLEGKIKDGVLYPSSTGSGKLVASYGGIDTSIDVNVYDNAVQLVVEPSELKLDNNQVKTLSYSVITDEGKVISLDPDLVKVEVVGNIGRYNPIDQTFTSGENGQTGYLQVAYNGLVTHAGVSIGTDKLLLADFETPTGLFVGYPESVEGKYREVNIPKNGNYSGILEYDFTHSNDTRAAYLQFNEPIVLPMNTESIGMWVLGDYANSHWLRAKILDADGAATNVTFVEHVDWTGWRYVTATLPPALKAPFTLERIYLVETDDTRMDSGTILFDDISAVVGRAYDIDIPKDVTKLKAIDDYRLSEGVKARYQFTYKNDATSARAELSAVDGYLFEDRGSHYLMKLNNKSGSIRTNGYTQWTKLIADLKKVTDKPLIIMTNSPLKFNDSFEAALFYKQIGYVSTPKIVVSPSSTDTFEIKMKQSTRIVTVAKTGGYIDIGINNGQFEYQLHRVTQ